MQDDALGAIWREGRTARRPFRLVGHRTSFFMLSRIAESTSLCNFEPTDR
jgi:hypothetical protein